MACRAVDEQARHTTAAFILPQYLLTPKEAPLLITPTSNSMHRLSKLTKRKGNGKSVTRRCRVCYQEGKRKETVYYCAVCPGEPVFVPKPSALRAHTTRGPAPGADDEQSRHEHDVTCSGQQSFRDTLDNPFGYPESVLGK
ncbi:hypothetical protein J6590_045662 [Homalodisca vitripennis]|nr:hypothetical protein J6590_045662 [Homalodisca vitripennis]